MESVLTGKSRLFFDWMPEKSGSLLDVGCAYSFMLNLLGEKADKKFGLDFDQEKLKEAKARFKDVHYVSGVGEALPFRDNSFDVVTFFEVLEHVTDENKFVSEISRILKPGGSIMLSVPNRGAAECLDADNIIFTPLLMIAKKMGFFKEVSDYYLRYHRHYSAGDIKRLFAPVFEIKKIYYGGLFANQIGFIIYKFFYIFLILFRVNSGSALFKVAHDWMDKITSWDFERNYGRISDKLCVYAVKTDK